MLLHHSRADVVRVRLSAALFTIACLVFGGFFSTSAASAATQADAEKSIVLVGITWTGFVEYPSTEGGYKWSDQVTSSAFCTGWFASNSGHIVTAGHCVDPSRGREGLIKTFLTQEKATNLVDTAIANWRVDGGSEGKGITRVVRVIQPRGVEGTVIDDATVVQVVNFKTFAEGDVALLHVAGLSKSTVPLPIANTKPEIGSSLTSIGYPSSVIQVSDGARIRASFKSGTVSSNQVNENGISGTEVNAEIGSGMSGGPTINEQGQVIGVNSYSAVGNAEPNFNFITDTENLRSFLEGNNVDFVAVTTSTPSPSSGISTSEGGGSIDARRVDDSSSPLPWVIGAVVLVLLLAAAFFILRKKNMVPSFVGNAKMNSAQTVPPMPVTAPVSHVAVVCLNGHENPAGTKFCSECGQSIERPSVD